MEICQTFKQYWYRNCKYFNCCVVQLIKSIMLGGQRSMSNSDTQTSGPQPEDSQPINEVKEQ